MEQNEYAKKLGVLLRKLRKQKGLTQKSLSKEDDPVDYICTARHLKRIEKGESVPTQHMLEQFLSILGVSFVEFHDMLYGNDLRLFHSNFDEIWNTGFKGNNEAYMQKLEVLKSKSYCDMKIPAIKQAIMLCEANVLSKIDKNHEASLDMLYEALRITTSKILSDNNEVNYEKMSELTITINEYRIIKLIANIKARLNKPKESLNITLAIVDSLESSLVSFDVKKKLLPTNYFNLSCALFDDNNPSGALDAAEKGIAFCNDVSDYKVLAELLYNKARALYIMGEIEESGILFQESYNTFKTTKNSLKAASVKKFAKEIYGISIIDK